nr:uncharacterized protein LOC100176869 [Ciona intestinalis]|eukprot:XP_009860528.1 uncharacterized protein LOC100176869 [Ciona intestinalis]
MTDKSLSNTDIIETNAFSEIAGPSTQDITTIQTVPPQPNPDIAVEETSPNNSFCCCGQSRDESLTEGNSQQGCCVVAPPVLRKILHSVAFYIYILISTFIVTLLLLAELLIDVGVINIPSSPDTVVLNASALSTLKVQTPAQKTSTILHWISFSFLSLFFIEIMFRLYAWKLNIIRSIVSVFDCSIVTMAIATNLAATLAAGSTSPFDAISLLIILRFIRIHSLIQRCVSDSKQEIREKLTKTECSLSEIQVLNQRLSRQAMDKDFEIKQLRAFLGTRASDLDEELRKAFAARDDSLGACGGNSSYDDQLQKAINLSKKTYDDENGYTNHGYQPTEAFPNITVHHRQNSIHRKPNNTEENLDFPSNPKDDVLSTEVAMHDDLHSTMDLGDTSALLLANSNNSNNKEWNANYCLATDNSNPFPTLPTSNGLSLIDTLPKPGNPLVAPDKPRITISIDPNILLTPDDPKNDSGVCDSDDGIGSSSSSTNTYNNKHNRNGTGSTIVSSSDLMSSDASCVSSLSICSESGYHSEDRTPGDQRGHRGHPNTSNGGSPNLRTTSDTDSDSGDGDSVNTVRYNECSTNVGKRFEEIEMKGNGHLNNINHFEEDEHKL